MNYKETLDYLFNLLPMYQRIGNKAFKKDLTNTLRLVEHLGHPHRQFKSIHIAGTNGKGSTAHMLAAILQAQGLKVGLYTSPHYLDFRERMKINGQLLGQTQIIEFVELYKELIEEIRPSFFEITAAMAFHFFAKENVDIAVIETGLGGEFDSTNVITPILSVITNISYDHQHILGNTLEEIAWAKAGIIKAGVPVVIGESQSETDKVFKDRADSLGSSIVFADQSFKAHPVRTTSSHTYFEVFKRGLLSYSNLKVNVLGDYQSKNICTALQTIEMLPASLKPDERIVRCGLSALKQMTNFIGRWNTLQERPKIIMDSAHNKAGILQIVDQLESIPYQKLHFVLGMVRDKDHAEILELLPKHASYYFTSPKIPRGLKAEKLRLKAEAFGLLGNYHPTVTSAILKAKENADEQDLIFIGGSIFVVADALEFFAETR